MYGKLNNGILIKAITPIFDKLIKIIFTLCKVLLFISLPPSPCPVAGAFFMYDNQSPLLSFFRQYQLSFFSLLTEHYNSSSCEYDNYTAKNCSAVNVIVGRTSVWRVRNFLIEHICVYCLSICYSDLF